jgi:hypothetical protein
MEHADNPLTAAPAVFIISRQQHLLYLAALVDERLRGRPEKLRTARALLGLSARTGWSVSGVVNALMVEEYKKTEDPVKKPRSFASLAGDLL